MFILYLVLNVWNILELLTFQQKQIHSSLAREELIRWMEVLLSIDFLNAKKVYYQLGTLNLNSMLKWRAISVYRKMNKTIYCKIN